MDRTAVSDRQRRKGVSWYIAVLLLPWALEAPAQEPARLGAAVHQLIGPPDSDFPGAVVGLDDVDGDGAPDFAVSDPGRPRPWGTGVVELRSGRTAEVLRVWGEQWPIGGVGVALGVLDDLDGDGLREVAFGHEGFAVSAFSPRTGAVLLSVPLYSDLSPRDPGGVGSLGDVDGDGTSDLFLADPQFPGVGADRYARGRVEVRSGASGRFLWRMTGRLPESFFGSGPVAVPDVDGDAIPDLLVGQPNGLCLGCDRIGTRPGQLKILSGADGRVLRFYTADLSLLNFGLRVVFLGDTDGDGRSEAAVSAYETWHFERPQSGWIGIFELPSPKTSVYFYTYPDEL